MKVTVAGTGYVGLVTGVCLAHIGHEVTCLDVVEEKIEMLKNGKSPIYEPDLEDLMLKNKDRLNFTTNYKKAYKDADVIFIGVGTPERIDGTANLDYVNEVARQISESIDKDTVVVIKSTVPIGTNDRIEEYLNGNIKNGIKVRVASNPEFLAEGTAVKDTLYASRIVIGTEDKIAEKVLKELYLPLTKKPYNVPLLSMDRRSAEMVKYASNDFLALKISYINEIANFCESVGANIKNVTLGMGYDPRIGNKFLNSGIGYGGSCFPKDTKALHWLSKSLDCELKTVKACIEVNKDQKLRLFHKLKNSLYLKDLEVAILGVTFKPNTDDLRDAPSIDNVELLLEYGANVTVYDPIGLDNFKKRFKDRVNYASSINEAIKDKEAVMIMTEWKEIKEYDLNNYVKYMNKANIFDGRNCYDLDDFKNIDAYYVSIGRKDVGSLK
ncbi:MAG: UDP-glucose/GDP-mannose dehydrogenase family protein [Bacilli bacterium]|nr:UDP-glucose/GDP-mannose dehydrogenase family protein [Bacilli bacterium]MBQ6283129.1 UDP-glucose/GDP-mannose dehydrogenase family protein [Bacilli bacterium]